MKNTHTLKPASIGSISHGTLRMEDLLSAYISELEWQISRNGDFLSMPENFAMRDSLNDLVGEAQDCFADDGETIEDEESAGYVLESMVETLEIFAPAYCYFGSHEGDGSDIGYWPCMYAIQELPQISDSDPDLAVAMGEDCAYVNDHGNIIVYGGDGSTILELV